jgi:hypothetical protein
VVLDATDEQLLRGLREANFCYLYAPAFHPAFKAVLGVRKQLAESGTKTVFNVLGPLINPARPAHMVVGIYDERWVEPLAATLGELGVKRGLVTRSRAGGGMDEIATAGEVRVRGCGELASVDAVWLPGDFGFKTSRGRRPARRHARGKYFDVQRPARGRRLRRTDGHALPPAPARPSGSRARRRIRRRERSGLARSCSAANCARKPAVSAKAFRAA